MTEIRHLIISGLVQGIGYRAGMAWQARSLGITGWVRNRRDGNVEAMVAGEAEAVAAIIDWARRGPPGATVDHVAVEAGQGAFSGFEPLPTAQ
jgi:acylphosphatase